MAGSEFTAAGMIEIEKGCSRTPEPVNFGIEKRRTTENARAGRGDMAMSRGSAGYSEVYV